MIKDSNHIDITKLTIRIKDAETEQPVGTGLVYHDDILIDRLYILTASHVLYKDSDSFQNKRESVIIDFYNETSKVYESLRHIVDFNLVSAKVDRDVAILMLNINEHAILKRFNFPSYLAVKERSNIDAFVIKGFPQATCGKEVVCIYPKWNQNLLEKNVFQLELREDYTGWSTAGFSGSGVFICSDDQFYLYGIFTRFREEEKGKIIYCQYIETINEILAKNYLPNIKFSFISENSLTIKFFEDQVKGAISNLGPRFDEDRNLKLPIASAFNDLAKDDYFKKKVIQTIDKWLVKYISGSHGKDYDLIEDILNAYDCSKKEVTTLIEGLTWNIEEKIHLDDFTKFIEVLNEDIYKKRNELYSLRGQKSKTEKLNDEYSSELARLHDISTNNSELLEGLSDINFSLSNNPFLIIKGEAGAGKSHLLGDIANQRIKRNEPTVLVLGQHFKKSKNVWENILSDLNLNCTKRDFLNSLNYIGKQINSRVLILIDALNEGAGKEIWPEELAGFINDLRGFQYIGVSVTIRTSYFNEIVGESTTQDPLVSILNHEGFKGNEYEALKLFCIFYELESPSFPILSPEFTNPLFLLLICEGLKNSGEKRFPQGFQNISKLFKLYLNSVCQKLSRKREEYKNRDHKIIEALEKFAFKCFEKENRNTLDVKETVDFFDEEFTSFKHLYNDLVAECVLIQKNEIDYYSNSNTEVVYFAFERIGDFVVAQSLLEKYEKSVDIIEAFRPENCLGQLVKDAWWLNKGVFEVFAILLPEKFQIEMVEAVDWIFSNKPQNMMSNIDEYIVGFMLDSLKWRSIESIDAKKILKFLDSKKSKIDIDEYLIKLIELAPIINHPFNSDRFFSYLNQFDMPERDSFWQRFVHYFSDYDDYKNAYPIRRLIDWAWSPEISSQIDKESARLVGQVLAWILSSTNRRVRDEASKALVNLLENQLEALLAILRKFSRVDDLYIKERLYAVTYGCVLRTSNKEDILDVAKYVYESIFRDGVKTVHILLRDYARNIIEYALYLNLPIEVDIDSITPPYISEFPTNIPSHEDIESLRFDYNEKGYKQSYKSEHNQIIFSVMDWDFGSKVVEHALQDFCPYSFTMEKKYKTFLKTLKKQTRDKLKLYEAISRYLEVVDASRDDIIKYSSIQHLDEKTLQNKSYLKRFYQELKSELNNNEFTFFKEKLIPFYKQKERVSDWHRDFFDVEPIKRWLTNRVFELGYNYEIHGYYDSIINSSSQRSEFKIERIGKKYQWIAFHEIMGVITDNFKYRDGWGSSEKYGFFNGPWQLYLRDIDPIFITKNREKDIYENDYNSFQGKKGWWFDLDYDHWSMSNKEWANSEIDLPDPRHIIKRIDHNKTEWLCLDAFYKWCQPKQLGQDKYRTGYKQIWYPIHSYLVKKIDKRKIVRWLNSQNFWGNRLPGKNDSILSLFNRELYWSPIAKNNIKEYWSKVGEKNYRIKATTTTAVGEMSEDKSGAHFYYDMPCKMIFEGMHLKYAAKDGEFKNMNGDIVVCNPDHNVMLIRKKDFVDFLNKNDLDIIWVVEGEKLATEDRFNTQNNHYKVINGVYTLEGDIIDGSLRLEDRVK